ncbi:MAG: 2-oxoacid:ferredoxin oxidoreductase subunit beta [Dehalococcoidia bacterium]|nr:2-oxoacid:ferredoxin oxidoreductase subunit beta [Dehalococcoidia bacterium]
MSAKNQEYDFKWCPGCGDFGVRRAIEFALKEFSATKSIPIEKTVVVAGIGCSGNLVHLIEGPQPFGIHGIHGRTLPIALGVKMARPELNVLVVAGDGDFLSIGAEHIGPQAQRNLNVCVVIMDNGVYGLTKGQSSPTAVTGQITTSTPYGKVEAKLNPLALYLSLGVSFVASGFSGKPRELAKLIVTGMEHKGFAIVHVQSPCTTYNDSYEFLKGDPKKNIEPALYDIPAAHDTSDIASALKLAQAPGMPIGILYHAQDSEPLETRLETMKKKAKARNTQELVNAFNI